MDLLERTIFLAIGMGIGFVLGYIVARLREIKEEVDEVLQIEKKRDERGAVKLSWHGIALLVVVLLCAYASLVSQLALNADKKNDKEALISRCQAGVDNRNVQRGLVDAVYNLATGAVARSKEDPPLTRAEIVRINAYIVRVNDFRRDTYADIKPSKECEPYASDGNVKPPSRDFPTIPVPEE